MSHEIRTPMNAVIGMTSLLLDAPLTAEQRDLVDIIRRSGDTLLTIIDDILDFSRAETGKLELARQPFDLHQCIDETAELLASRAFEKGVEFVYLIQREVPHQFQGDVVRLRQILANLISNAIKFTDAGEIVLTVTLSTSPDGQPEVLFSVRDTGIGIAPQDIHRLFQSFSQVDTSTTRRYGGTGLGLAISKRLCELMGGRIWVHSDQYVGSTFSFTLPAHNLADTPQPSAETTGDDLAGRHVLLVDDNASSRQVLEYLAAGWAMASHSAAGGAEALWAWKGAGQPDVVVIDQRLGDMSGIQLIRQFRQLASHVPAILLIGFSDSKTKEDADRLGAVTTLYKPVRPSQLRRCLVQCLGAPAPAAPVQVSPDEPVMAIRHPLRILLVEDNLVNQKVALRMLERLGYRADVAVNGQQAVDAARDHSYDVVLMDVHMPVMDGIDATHQIRALAARTSQPYIIAMTAAAMPTDRDRCLQAGMNDFLAKPFRVEDVAAALLNSFAESPEPGRTSAPESVPSKQAAAAEAVDDLFGQSALASLYAAFGCQDVALLAEVITAYTEDAPGQLAAMQRAAAAEDVEALALAAHSLKSATQIVGATMPARLSGEIEALARGNRLEEASAQLPALATLIQQVMDQLVVWLQSYQ